MRSKVDVLICGAGTAGAATAAFCAARGLDVLCIDRRPLDGAGARWVNGVTRGSFAEAGVDLPIGDELVSDSAPFHLIAGYGPKRLTVTTHDLLDVDMRRLVARLQALAIDAGAELIGDVRLEAVGTESVATSAGEVRARAIVDATGLNGAGLLGQVKMDPQHICAAAQEVRRIADDDAARRFFEGHAVRPGEALCFSGIEGGYSILNLKRHGGEIGILTGSIPAAGFASGKRILDRFVDAHPWIGPRVFGGARAIPVRRPFDRLGDRRIALVGDAGAQVFGAHGSGIGPGMVAARILAETLAGGGTPWDYAVRWQRGHGGRLAAYDVFRRFSQTLSSDGIAALIDAGLMDPATTAAALEQRMPQLDIKTLPAKVAGLLRQPRVSGRLAAVAARMMAVQAQYGRYPSDPAGMPSWSRRVATLFGESPDVPS